MSRLWIVLLFPFLLAGTLRAAEVLLDPEEVLPGGIAIVRVADRSASGTFAGRRLRFFRAEEQSIALIGVDLDERPGRHPVQVTTASGNEVRRELRIVAHDFPEERLTVPKTYTDLDRTTLARVRGEQKRLEALWSRSRPDRLWEGAFVMPADGPSGSPFGLRRFFNGEPRSPHAGIDIKAPTGAPVRAANRGRVVLADDLFFTGKTVVLDHGLGLFTMYVHLSRIAARPGYTIARGGEIGRVGATGRATGPHLHFATRIGTARVNPEALLGRDLEGSATVAGSAGGNP